jgi:hypothetical protein
VATNATRTPRISGRINIDMAKDNIVFPEVVQGDPEVTVQRQSGVDLQRQSFDNDPIAHMPVIQADPETFVSRQTGIMEVDAEHPGVLRADRPAPQARIVSDVAIPANKDAGFPGHPGVVPGNPQHPYGRRATDRPDPGSEDAVKRQGTKKELEAAAAPGTLRADQPIPADKKAGVEGHPGVVPGNPNAVQFTAEQLAAAKKTQHADRPSPLPDPRLAVHDPAEYQRQMAEASAANHPKAPRGRAKGSTKKAGRKGATKRQSGKRAARANPTGPMANPNPAAARIAEGDRSTATEPAPDPVIDLDAEKAQMDAEEREKQG